MRLIDADKIPWTDLNDNPNSNIKVLVTFAEKVNRMPTIEERKTGKWKRAYLDHEAMGERPSVLYCSICNQCIAYPTNYCPNCGADMRGEGHE